LARPVEHPLLDAFERLEVGNDFEAFVGDGGGRAGRFLLRALALLEVFIARARGAYDQLGRAASGLFDLDDLLYGRGWALDADGGSPSELTRTTKQHQTGRKKRAHPSTQGS